jgi:hypothetical protein
VAGVPRWPRAHASLSLLWRRQSERTPNPRLDNPELARIYEEDQGDRRESGAGPIDWSVVGPRDDARRRAATALLALGGARTSVDFFRAAMVFQHGSDAADFQRTHALALKAIELDPTNDLAKWMAAASKDRELMVLKKPQLYGTQLIVKGGVWSLYGVDPSVTDEERARWNVPPIAQARRKVEERNARHAK